MKVALISIGVVTFIFGSFLPAALAQNPTELLTNSAGRNYSFTGTLDLDLLVNDDRRSSADFTFEALFEGKKVGSAMEVLANVSHIVRDRLGKWVARYDASVTTKYERDEGLVELAVHGVSFEKRRTQRRGTAPRDFWLDDAALAVEELKSEPYIGTREQLSRYLSHGEDTIEQMIRLGFLWSTARVPLLTQLTEHDLNGILGDTRLFFSETRRNPIAILARDFNKLSLTYRLKGESSVLPLAKQKRLKKFLDAFIPTQLYPYKTSLNQEQQLLDLMRIAEQLQLEVIMNHEAGLVSEIAVEMTILGTEVPMTMSFVEQYWYNLPAAVEWDEKSEPLAKLFDEIQRRLGISLPIAAVEIRPSYEPGEDRAVPEAELTPVAADATAKTCDNRACVLRELKKEAKSMTRADYLRVRRDLLKSFR
ncbi:MAG: hypothetical protein Q8P95_01105 [bacterium]|nr:hypothetical protein [bacterium]